MTSALPQLIQALEEIRLPVVPLHEAQSLSNIRKTPEEAVKDAGRICDGYVPHPGISKQIPRGPCDRAHFFWSIAL
ncbi:MAG: hypothetical protein ACXWIE_01030 [Burkholderiales bacterium]